MLTDLCTANDCVEIGNLFFGKSEFPKATAFYERALALEPDSSAALTNLSNALKQSGDFPGALERANQAIAADPRNALALKARSLVYQEIGKFAEAERDLWAAITLDGNDSRLWNSMGYHQQLIGNLPVAVTAYTRSAQLNPFDFDSRLSVALSKMASGDWSGDTLNEYEVRHLIGGNPCPQNGKPVWNGEPVEGKTVMLCAEQGMGDAVMFARYARLLQQRGAKVIALCTQPWSKLLWRAYGISNVCTQTDQLPDYDFHVGMMSCLRLMGVYSGDGAYLDFLAPAEFPHERPTVGFCASGNSAHRNDKYRSLPKGVFAPMIAGNDIEAIWLGKGEAGIENPMQLANAINRCDLVISVDTAVVHIAGALARPVWTLLPVNADFRWAKGEQTTPWYESMRLFRCAKILGWGPVLERVEDELRKWREGWK